MTQNHGLDAARRALTLPKRKPDTADRPPPSVPPGRKPRRIAGQLALHERPEEEADDAA